MNMERKTKRSRTKNRNSVYIILLAVLIIIGIALIIFGLSRFFGWFEPTQEPDNSSSTVEPTEKPTPKPTEHEPTPTQEPTPEPTEEPTPEPTEEPTPEPIITYPTDPDLLLLANKENPLPDEYLPNLTYYDVVPVASVIYDDLVRMMNDANNYGGSLWIASGYRSIEEQGGILWNATQNRMRDYDMTEEEAREHALQTIALPGTSEHNTGMAVDFNYVTYDFENTAVYAWLFENSANYGFIQRYQKHKEDITGYNYEPWHFRYVGVEAAKEMNELDMCLEEYLDYLDEQ